jgi:cysteinyl-tRNA synthetase
MRLQDTLTGTLVELPPSPEPVGIYVCGPTVYQRAHIGNARPFVVFTWLARWLREQGHAVRLVHNITDVNDRIYEAAPGRSAERALEATAWYLEDTEGFGLGMPDALPLATETMPEIIELIEDLVASGHAYTASGDVYFRVSRFETYGALSGQRPDQVEEQEPNPAKEDPRDFALWKATKEGEDTSWEAPWGVGRPGWHIECSAMAAKELGPEFWIHGGGLDLVFPHHENERAQSLSVGHPFARIWMHNGMLRFTGEKMSKSVGYVETIRDVLDRWGRETALVFFLTAHWRKPIDFSDETMAAAQAQAETLRNALRAETRAVGDPARLGSHGCARRAQARPRRVRSREPRRDVHRAGRRRRAGRGANDRPCPAGLRRGRPHSWRDRRPRMGRPGCGRRLRARPARVIRDLVYGRNAVREALRGRRSVLEVWVGERAAATLEWLSEGPKPRVRRERELTEAAGSPDHQGVVAWCEPYPYADAWELALVERPLLCCLDQVTDPRNLGAVVRSAAGAGATGVVLPAHGAAVVTPAVCRSSAGAVEHLPVAVVPNLARYLGEVKGDRLWAFAASADGDSRLWDLDLTDGTALVFGAEGKGVRPLVRRTCDATLSVPLAAGVESLNVSVAAAVTLFEARRQRTINLD